MKSKRTVIIGNIGAVALVFAALLAIAYPTPTLRAGLAILTPLVVAAAFAGAWNDGRCPDCRARRGQQQHVQMPAHVQVASRTFTHGGEVVVDLGWEVSTGELVTCQACRHEYSSKSSVFVSRNDARSASEALVVAQQARLAAKG